MPDFGDEITGCRWFNGNVDDYLTETPVQTYRVTMRCPICEKGEMKATGVSWPMYPPGVHHQCDECGKVIAIRNRQFPTVVRKPC